VLQELWEMLHSASQNPSGIPQKILDEKAEEIRAKKEKQNEINVSTVHVFCLTYRGIWVIYSC
jgi:hypothetical protein